MGQNKELKSLILVQDLQQYPCFKTLESFLPSGEEFVTAKDVLNLLLSAPEERKKERTPGDTESVSQRPRPETHPHCWLTWHLCLKSALEICSGYAGLSVPFTTFPITAFKLKAKAQLIGISLQFCTCRFHPTASLLQLLLSLWLDC